jgi:hypothetical protein
MIRSSCIAVAAFSLLGLLACAQAKATNLTDANGDDPKLLANPHNVQFMRDSVFHSYLDSLDLRIETLNRAARTVDSLARSLRNTPSLKLHVNGHCFGPIHIPSQNVGPDSIQVTTPEVNIPEIEIPDIDIEIPHVGADGTMLYDGKGSIGGAPSYYYSQGDSRFYIQNVRPNRKAKRPSGAKNVWLVNGK